MWFRSHLKSIYPKQIKQIYQNSFYSYLFVCVFVCLREREKVDYRERKRVCRAHSCTIKDRGQFAELISLYHVGSGLKLWMVSTDKYLLHCHSFYHHSQYGRYRNQIIISSCILATDTVHHGSKVMLIRRILSALRGTWSS